MPAKSQHELPEQNDLTAQIGFDLKNGKIWLHEQRLLLTPARFFKNLRAELITTLGPVRTKSLSMRLGYLSGWRDAQLANALRPDLSAQEKFWAGPQLAELKGMVNIKQRRLELDREAGLFYAEFEWFDAFEVEGIEAGTPEMEPMCWFLTGYASGNSSYYMGCNVLFREVQCKGCGADHCLIIGKTAEHWEEREELEAFLIPDKLVQALQRLQDQMIKARNQASFEQDPIVHSIGRSPEFRHACALLKKAMGADIAVLLQGETGVGKEIFARSLHQGSERRNGPFVAVNCACFPPDLIEAELFGVEKGAYTGAHSSREGKFERANGGTLFLDEVVELPARAQAALLRALQEGEIERIGGGQCVKVNVRIVAASHENLRQAVEQGRFRADLYYRLSAFPITIPPLRERREDIPLLIEHFLGKFQERYSKRIPGMTDKARQTLMQYAWPGNIRELENIIERGALLVENNQLIDVPSLFPSLREPTHPLNYVSEEGRIVPGESDDEAFFRQWMQQGQSIGALESRLAKGALKHANGNISQAARLLGLTRAQMIYRLEKLKNQTAQ